MWEHVEVVGELDTVILAIKEGRAIWCTDGSFDRLQMPNVSSAGWVIFDPVSKQHIKGSFFKISEDASAYRGELLGLTALHLVAAAITELFGVMENSNELFCDNKRALGKAKLYRRRVPSASKHGDLLRLLRNLCPQLMTAFIYLHVYGHADDKKGRGNLTLVERLNCMCDALAKLARLRYWTAEREVTTQILPKERAALFLHNQKQTGDISGATRYAIGKVQARLFYVNELGWTAERFDSVDWDALNATLSKKDLMYTLWLTKQATKFCGSRVQVARMTPGSDDRCPNCFCPEERASHLNLCPDPDRTRQFMSSVDELGAWLHKDHTHPDIAFWVPRYLKARNRVLFQDLPSYAPIRAMVGMSSQMRAVAIGQDSIGWTHFLEGKITGHFLGMQCLYLRTTHCKINADNWVKGFITKILAISHTQWIFWNITLHDQQHGHLALLCREKLIEEIEKLQALDPDDVPPESTFLLEFDIDSLGAADITKQEQWIMAMQAARKAGVRRQGRCLRWKKIPWRKCRILRRPPTQVFCSHNTFEHLQQELFSDILPSMSHRRPSEAVLTLLEPSNKRRKRRRKEEDSNLLHSSS
jgi:hypothetical protein